MLNIKFLSVSTWSFSCETTIRKSPWLSGNWYFNFISICQCQYIKGFWYIFAPFWDTWFVFPADPSAALPVSAASTCLPPQPWCSPHTWGAMWVCLLPVSGSWSAKGSHTLGEGFAKTKPRTLRQEAVSILQSLYFHCKGKNPFYSPCWHSRLVLPSFALLCTLWK